MSIYETILKNVNKNVEVARKWKPSQHGNSNKTGGNTRRKGWRRRRPGRIKAKRRL